MSSPFNPLDRPNLARAVATQIEQTEAVPLEEASTYIKRRNIFTGAGVYAIYYHGNFEPYAKLAQANAEGSVYPIYVGKAVPEGARKGGEEHPDTARVDDDVVESGTRTTKLAERLREHRRSILAAENLDLDHFTMRWLVVEDIWIPLGESAMIRNYRPVWNAVVDGFGNHDPGSGRKDGVRSQWDTLHPGRKWAYKYPARPAGAESLIAQDARQYLDTRLN
ncbi:Eco29kI family restriction endonuclease [Dietzia alimentaria]|uniref:Eco29kI family restriction endonuclease n=1 Tax=Dietzia alimentaria TaxID=665550 RepID=UPI00029B2288|nr:Eco29kI family restriction endonuclease [Dietzia alimentaria]